MNSIEKWADRVYAETDFGRSIATSIAGIAGLVVYLVWRDWTIAAFISIIIFPIVRIIGANIHDKMQRQHAGQIAQENAEAQYDKLSVHEKHVVQAFVQQGGCVLTWSHMNQLELSGPAIESLLQRELLSTSMTADGMRETFVLDPAIFDIGQKNPNPTGAPNPSFNPDATSWS